MRIPAAAESEAATLGRPAGELGGRKPRSEPRRRVLA